MLISYKKTYDAKNKRVEFVLVNFDYYDGNELLANIFHDEFGFKFNGRTDNIWNKIIRMALEDCIYVFFWHEDVGNSIYCLNQSEYNNNLLEERIKKAIDIVNIRIQACE